MPSAMGLLEERERVALARAEELRAELERLRVAVAEAEEAARRAVIAREELVDALSSAPARATEAVAREAGAGGTGAMRKAEVPVWREGLEKSVLPKDYAGIVSLVEHDGAEGGGGVRARGLRDGLSWQATDAREQAARFRAKKLVERGWLIEAGPGLFRPRPGRCA